MQSCPICGADVPVYYYDHPNGALIRCPACGTYRLMERAHQHLIQGRIAAGSYGVIPPHYRLSAALRERSEAGIETVLSDPDTLEALAKNYTPAEDPLEVMERILAYLGRKGSHNNYVPLIGHRDHGVAGAERPETFDYALGELSNDGLVQRRALDEAAYRVTKAGWERLREVRARATQPVTRPDAELQGATTATNNLGPFVAEAHIEALRSAPRDKFDLTKLVRLCEELNIAWANGCLYSVAMLVRTILNHVPPLFGKGTFAEVANNFAGKSIKRNLDHLSSSARPIADGHAHELIRPTEVLPTPTEVDFGRDLAVLLREIIRVLPRADSGT